LNKNNLNFVTVDSSSSSVVIYKQIPKDHFSK